MISQNIKNWGSLIVAVSGLVTAIGASVRKPPEEAAKAGYIELTKAILDTQEAAKQNHLDIVELDKYVRGRAALGQSQGQSASSSAPPPPPALRAEPRAPTRAEDLNW